MHLIKMLEKEINKRIKSYKEVGQTLTREQAEFFNESKIRDDDGNLLGYYEKHEFRNKETADTYDFSKSLV